MTTPDEQAPEPTTTAPPTAEQDAAPVILHREYLLANWRDLDPCLWRFFRASGFRTILESDDVLRHLATGQVVYRGETRGEVVYTITVLLDPGAEDGGEGQPYRTLGTFALFPQLNGSTCVQVIRFSDSTAEIDQALVNLWKEARAWMLEQANGQPAPQRARAAMPRRVSTS